MRLVIAEKPSVAKSLAAVLGEESVTLEEAVEQVRRCVADGQKLTQACKTVAAETGYRKSELYDAVQES